MGTCCHGHRILVTPWEISRLADALDLSPRELRDTRLTAGGTQLRADGIPGIHGPPNHRVPGCTFYDPTFGCSVHAERPLACRLYPLGRERHDGAIRYYHPGQVMPCRVLCPTVDQLPQRTVGEYLAEQDIRAGEAAHDAYAALAYGLVRAALVFVEAGAIPRASLQQWFATARTWNGEQCAAHLPPTWYDLLTIPPLSATPDARRFVADHGRSLSEQLQAEFLNQPSAAALQQAAQLELLLALHLGPTVGAETNVMAALIDGSTP
jgi:Fe-S-cluster containining protein